MLPFPELSRIPSIKTKERTLDPTQRDPMENGQEGTQAQFTRFRREWDITFQLLSPDDRRTLRDFVTDPQNAFGGVNEFIFPDYRDKTNPETLLVRFATLPQFDDKDNVDEGTRSDCTFTLREV